MVYRTDWIKKNMGISRKTLLEYEEKGFIKPIRNPSNNKYREYSEEDLKRIWHIKFFVKLGYSLKEVGDIISNPNFDFRESISKKIEGLEEQKRQLEQLINHAKFIKATGIFPSVPEEMGSTKFEDFIEYSYKSLNINATPQLARLYQMLEYALLKSDIEWGEEDVKQLFEMMIEKPESEWSKADMLSIIELFKDTKPLLILNSYWEELASLSGYKVSHQKVQALVRKMYDFEREHLFPDFSDRMTPQWYAQHVPAYFSGSDIAILNERKLGKENCEFIVSAIEYFGNHAE